MQIYKLLHERILSQMWKVGSTLPNEGDLAREFGVSVGTMRKALQELETAGWITRRQGRGTFVSDPRQISRKRLDHFHLNGEHFSIDGFGYISSEREPVSAEVQPFLELKKDDSIIRVRRKKLIKGIIRIYEDVHIVERAISKSDLRELSDDDFMEYSSFIRRCTERVRPSVADGESASHLGVEPGTAVLICDRTAYDSEGKPIEWCRRTVVMESVEYWTEAA
ncbi:MAG: GntR family transcriptional regulator [Filomicrobium sp.]